MVTSTRDPARSLLIGMAVSAALGLALWSVSRESTSLDLPLAAGAGSGSVAAASGLINSPRSLMLASRSGGVLVGLAAQRGGPVDILVFGEEEQAVSDAVVQISVDGRSPRRVAPGQCGRGCFRLEESVLDGNPTVLDISVSRSGKPQEAVVLRIPRKLPPRADATLAAAKRTMIGLRSVRVTGTITAGGKAVESRWAIRAPDRLEVTSSDGGHTVLIGKRRWDLIDGAWKESPWSSVRQPWYPWERARSARVLGRTQLAGKPVTRLAVFTSKPEPWWFVLYVGSGARVLRQEMLAPSHFMVESFSGFNEPVTIEPPRS